jgi:Toprim-like/CHC2 zinc finger
MNIDQAKAIPIAEILLKLNLKPTRQANNETWYLSPLRKEKTASFHVHNKRNWWYDFGIGIGGDGIELVQQYLKSQKECHTVSDALRWLHNMVGNPSVIQPIDQPVETIEAHSKIRKLVIKSVKDVQHPGLIRYLEKRGIPLSVAKSILKEVRIKNVETDKNIFALGLLNEEDCYEVRNPFFKACIDRKDISFIRGSQPKPKGIHIFEGFMDYLSFLTQQNGKSLEDDTIILNSIACIRQATPYIKGYGYTIAYTYMDNDLAGQKATKSLEAFLKTEEGLVHKAQNKLYAPFKDVNAWHMHSLGL